MAPRVRGVRGFRAAGLHCGIKPDGAPDLALILSDRPATAAGVFTQSRFPGAPVVLTRRHIRSGRARAIVTTSGNANVATGAAGHHGQCRAPGSGSYDANFLHALTLVLFSTTAPTVRNCPRF